ANVIDANTQYHVAFSFGPDGLELWLDGELLGSTDYTGGLGGNFEPLVIGANQWSSSAGQSDKINHVFNGTVEDVALYDTQLDAGTISLIADGGSGGGGPVVDPNQAPDAADDTAVVEQGDSVRVKVLQNDSDPDGDTVTIVDVDDPANGTATLNNNGSITYTPDAGFSGEETFTYTVSDGTDTDTASVSVTVEPSDPVGGGTVTVSSLAELEDALDAATGGETILLANGNYGVLDIDGFRFAEFVTIRSASDLGAKFTKITVDNSSHIMIDGVHVDAPTNGGVGSAFVDIGAGSTDISFLNSEVNGSVNGKMVGAYGIRVHENSRQIDVSGNTVHDVEHGAVFFGVSDLVVSENDFNTLGSDSMKFGGVTDTLIENNSGASVTVPANGDHLDFIQFQGDGTDVTIRGNVFLLKEIKGFPSYPHQGIFLKDGEFNNVLIEQNLIYTNTVNAIYVSSKGGSGGNVTIRENTVLSPPDQTIWGNADIRMVSLGGDYVIENNVVDRVVDSVGGGQVSGNLSLQWERPGSANHYNSVYLDATAGGNATIDDFRPVPGGPADVGSGVGAEERISELTGSGEPMPNRAPNAANDMVETGIGEAISIAVLANDGDPDGDSLSIQSLGSANNGQVSADSNGVLTYTPNAGFSGIDKFEYTVTDGEATDTATVSVMVAVQEAGGASVIGTAMGLTEISGRSDVIEIAPDDAFEVSEATIALGFNADTVSGKHGLVSKDASNFAGGGNHFAAYIENGVLKVRFQDGQSSLTLQATGIRAGQDYEMVTSFGDGEVSLWLDGRLADSAAFSTSWETNGEYLQFGANGWASKTGASGFTDVFDGTISDAVIADSVLKPNELETIVRDMRADGSIQPADNDWSFDLL
ncbi:MAG: Ig-like domain-containing protein, partial [Pseudomonadota bacterium]